MCVFINQCAAARVSYASRPRSSHTLASPPSSPARPLDGRLGGPVCVAPKVVRSVAPRCERGSTWQRGSAGLASTCVLWLITHHTIETTPPCACPLRSAHREARLTRPPCHFFQSLGGECRPSHCVTRSMLVCTPKCLCWRLQNSGESTLGLTPTARAVLP